MMRKGAFQSVLFDKIYSDNLRIETCRFSSAKTEDNWISTFYTVMITRVCCRDVLKRKLNIFKLQEFKLFTNY